MNNTSFIIFLLFILHVQEITFQNLQQAKFLLNEINMLWANAENRYILAQWNYDTNITEENLNALFTTSRDVAKYQKLLWNRIVNYPWKNITNRYIRRQFELFSTNIDLQILPDELYFESQQLIINMISILTKVRIRRNQEGPAILTLPDVEEIFRTSRDPEELLFLWTEWTKTVGPEVRKNYPRYVELMNRAAKLQNLPNAEILWLRHYSDFTSIKSLARTWWKQLEPFYKELHAYVRYKLRLKYGDLIREDGGIPAHLCGNLFGVNWREISDIILPYPISQELKIDEALKQQNFTPLSIMRTADDFLVSLQLKPLPEIFWSKSILEQPRDGREVVLGSCSYNLHQNCDVFVSTQLTISASSYFKSHWFASACRFERTPYQPYIFEDMLKGVDTAISEAVLLSVKSWSHLRKFSFLPEKRESYEQKINNLLHSALDLVFLPQAYVVDLWRWNVFAGKITTANYNSAWWSLKFAYEGIEPGGKIDQNQFDLGDKFHVLYGMEYFQYYLGNILSFQIHKALCTEAGFYLGRNAGKLLHQCDIYGSFEAGNLLKKALQLGRSKPFPDFLEALTGERSVNVSVLLEYYEPLMSWLQAENRKNGVTPGWSAQKVKVKNLRFDLRSIFD